MAKLHVHILVQRKPLATLRAVVTPGRLRPASVEKPLLKGVTPRCR